YTGNIKITTPVAVVDVPVTVIRAPRNGLTFALVSAVSPDGVVLARAAATAATGWTYKLENVPLGRWRIVTFADQNDDSELDRVDEWDGAWPLRSQPQLLD